MVGVVEPAHIKEAWEKVYPRKNQLLIKTKTGMLFLQRNNCRWKVIDYLYKNNGIVSVIEIYDMIKETSKYKSCQIARIIKDLMGANILEISNREIIYILNTYGADYALRTMSTLNQSGGSFILKEHKVKDYNGYITKVHWNGDKLQMDME